MTSRRKIEIRIRKKEEEIQSLELKIRETRSYVQALQDVMKILPRDKDVDAKTLLRSGSAVAQAREVILEAGNPLHISTIIQSLGRVDNRKSRTAIAGSISAYVRKGEIFTRTAPNTYGLVEFPSVGQPKEDEPPEDFGANIDDSNEPPF